MERKNNKFSVEKELEQLQRTTIRELDLKYSRNLMKLKKCMLFLAVVVTKCGLSIK
jgi:hypothetical protein